MRTFFSLLILIVASLYASTSPAQPTVSNEIPPDECHAAWSKEVTEAFVDELVQATATALPVWGDYDLGDGVYVIDAGASDEGNVCLGVWQNGRAMAFAALPESPKLSTILYGIYRRPSGTEGETPTYSSSQPASVQDWFDQMDLESAIIMPVEFPKLPFKLPALDKAQTAIHEGFHVMVQMPQWSDSTDTGNWPVWDRQPDRDGLQVCYTRDDDIKTMLEDERENLVQLIEALLEENRSGACTAGRNFLDKRAVRYSKLEAVTVALHDGSPGTCADAEALMEIEEGTADYASWVPLYNLGRVSRERLIRRYRALQNDMFYLTGAMQLHAVSLMRPDDMPQVIRNIIASTSVAEGAPTSILKQTLDAYCQE